MRDMTQELLATLRADHPMFDFWIVHRVYGGPVWCAKPKGLDKPVLNADSLDELEEKLARHRPGVRPGHGAR
jgi:hypothetical protein